MSEATVNKNDAKAKRSNNYYGRRIEADACLEEKEMLAMCNTINGNKAPLCADYCLNWQKCQTFWDKIKAERRAAGIRPELPPLNEREAILKARFSQND